MTTAATESQQAERDRAFEHEALFYADDSQFMDGTLSFVTEGVARDEPVLVVLAAEKIAALRHALGDDANRVQFADMAEVGANPARIIPAWKAFANDAIAARKPFRGIGEPIWASRTADELVECQRHEALLNLAFADTRGFRLLCPYDTSALGADVLAEAQRSHPILVHDDAREASAACRPLAEVAAPFDTPLPPPPYPYAHYPFGPADLGAVRAIVSRHAADAGLSEARANDLLVAVNEIATNSLVHGGGRGSLNLWRQPDALVCEIVDEGRIVQALVGRERPRADKEGGRGLWLANQLCDLVQVRCFADGSKVRLHMRT